MGGAQPGEIWAKSIPARRCFCLEWDIHIWMAQFGVCWTAELSLAYLGFYNSP